MCNDQNGVIRMPGDNLRDGPENAASHILQRFSTGRARLDRVLRTFQQFLWIVRRDFVGEPPLPDPEMDFAQTRLQMNRQPTGFSQQFGRLPGAQQITGIDSGKMPPF